MNSAACISRIVRSVLVIMVIGWTILARPILAAESIALEHRPVHTVIPLLQPLLKHNEAVTGQGQMLFLEASQGRAQTLRKIIHSLDRPLQMLDVTIIRGQRPAMDAVRKRPAKRYTTQPGFRPGQSSQTRVLEGETLVIRHDLAVPVVEQAVIIDATRTLTRNTVNYEHRYSGVIARPLLNGNRVYLEVTTEQGSADEEQGGAWKTSRITSTLTGLKGEWIRLHGVPPLARELGTGGGELRTATRRNDSEQIWIRIDTDVDP